MTSATIITGLADLAEAAYIDFGTVGLSGLRDAALGEALRTSGVSWPSSRTGEFIKNWRVVAHQPDTSSGFSGTVFERVNPKSGEERYVFAARGTAGIVDIAEDLANLVANGLAWQQIIDMYNWWKELSTPLGSTYKRASFEPLLRVTPHFVVEFGLSYAIKLTDTVQQTMPRLSSSELVDVTGHSLGGHLATAFSRLFGANTQNVVTINPERGQVFHDSIPSPLIFRSTPSTNHGAPSSN